ncbi:unnamed protein product [Prorocentrum cordatum]|uniref:Uncharacterized protein n=1 Tax=Prorocentrum cordatum TaxID=2364126 RepID=A0ABN9UYS0_9DINO|nr:unnamed protein product [Polarella glacialis]
MLCSGAMAMTTIVPHNRSQQCHDDDGDVMWGDRYPHVRVRWPDLVGITMQQRVTQLYCVTESIWIPAAVETVGGLVWTCDRSPFNKRGDAASAQSRKRSVEKVGILNIRAGPWVVPRDEIDITVYADKGLQAAVNDEGNAGNSVVEASLRDGLQNCKVFHKRTPAYVQEYLVDVGNETNDEQSSRTALQVLMSHDSVEPTFFQKKKLYEWSVASLGQRQYAEKRFEVAESMFVNRWRSSHQSDQGLSAYKEAKHKDNVLPSGKRVRDAVWEQSQASVDWMHPAINGKHWKVIDNFVHCMKLAKKGFPGYAVDLFLLSLPRIPTAVAGVSTFLPQGLDTSKLHCLTELHVENLLLPMEGSTALKDVEAARVEASAKKKAHKRRRTVALEEGPGLDSARTMVWLDDVTNFLDYCSSKLRCDADAINSMKYISMYATSTGSACLYSQPNGQKQTVITKWSTLRNIMKKDAYRRSQLQPRPTDPDFNVGETLDAAPIQDDVHVPPEDMISDYLPVVGGIVAHLKKRPPDDEESWKTTVAQGVWAVVMSSMAKIYSDKGCSPGAASKYVVEAAADFALTLLPFNVDVDFEKLLRAIKDMKSDVPEVIGNEVMKVLEVCKDSFKFCSGAQDEEPWVVGTEATYNPTFPDALDKLYGAVLTFVAHDTAALENDAAAFKERICKMKGTDLGAMCKQEKCNFSVPKSHDMFPEQKQAALNEIVKCWEATYPDFNIVKLAGRCVKGEASPADVMGGLHLSMPAPPAGACAGGAAAAASSGDLPAEVTCEDDEDKTHYVDQWFKKACEAEVGIEKEVELKPPGACAVASPPFSAVFLRRLINQVQEKLFPLHLDPKLQGVGSEKLVLEQKAHPSSTAMVIKQSEPGDVQLNFRGSVVEYEETRGLSESSLLHLGSSNGVSLFLNGSRFQNFERSDFNLAWLVKVSPDKKADDSSSHAPEVKKRKSNTKEAPPVITHKLAFESVEFDLVDPRTKQVYAFSFKKPLLVPNPDLTDDQKIGELLREKAAGVGDVIAKKMPKAPTTSFAIC